jgi:hypothetical protein
VSAPKRKLDLGGYDYRVWDLVHRKPEGGDGIACIHLESTNDAVLRYWVDVPSEALELFDLKRHFNFDHVRIAKWVFDQIDRIVFTPKTAETVTLTQEQLSELLRLAFASLIPEEKSA